MQRYNPRTDTTQEQEGTYMSVPSVNGYAAFFDVSVFYSNDDGDDDEEDKEEKRDDDEKRGGEML